MSSATSSAARRLDSNRRRLVQTPEGIPLEVTLASRGARLMALILDYAIIFVGLFLTMLVLLFMGIELAASPLGGSSESAVEFLIVIFTILLFLAFNGYFIFFEMGPRGATPGKRIVAIRVAARPKALSGERLTAEAVIARNLLRQIEIFLPLSFFQTASSGDAGYAWVAGSLWFAIFMLFPFLNRDALRAGDVIAGTWVVEAPRARLADALSLETETQPGAKSSFDFGEKELGVYGEHELQLLERVLREGDEKTMAAVYEAITRKIGWQADTGEARPFLEAFYTALRAKLEGDLRFGKRKRDKHDQGSGALPFE